MHPTHFSPAVPIDNDAKQLARQIAMKQLTPQTAKWTYLKILAVLALYEYLIEQQKVEVILEESNSWDTCSNLIIFVPEAGRRIECLPVLPGSQQCLLPNEIVADRIYIAVQFYESSESVNLLGFVPASDVNISNLESEQCPLSALKPLDGFVELLLNTSPANDSLHEDLVDLSKWFAAVFDEVWQPVEVFLGLQDETYDFIRANAGSFQTASAGFCEESPAEVDRGTLIDLGKDRGQVILRLSIQNQNDEELYVLVEVRPLVLKDLLPANLAVAVIVGEEVLENKLEEPDKCLQVEPDCFKYGDRFDIQIAIDEVKIIKNFIFSLESMESTSNEKT